MSDDLFLRYGRAVFEVRRWTVERDTLLAVIEQDAITAGRLPLQQRTTDDGDHMPPYESPGKALKEYRSGGRYRGLIKQVAIELAISQRLVAEAARGLPTSKRIARAIAVAEKRRDEALMAMDITPLTDLERREFAHGGRYRGILRVVSRNLKKTTGTVERAAAGSSKSYQILAAIRLEMAKRDAEHTAKQEPAE